MLKKLLGSKRRPRRSRRIVKKRSYYKMQAPGKREVLVNRVRANLHMPIAPRFMTKFYLERSFSLPVGTAASGIFEVKLNSPDAPLGGVIGTTLGGGSKSDNPKGYNELLSTSFYNNFRVYGTKVTITWLPEALADGLYFIIAPYSSGSTPPSAIAQLESMPYSKQRIVSCNNNIAKNTITVYMDVATIEGVKKEVVQTEDDFTGTISTDPVKSNGFAVGYQLLSNAVTTAVMAYTVKVEYYLELFNLKTAQL